MGDFVYPEEVDQRLTWPLGTATRLARRRRLPHYVLPDGSLRFRLAEVEALVRRVPRDAETGGQGVAYAR
jgi:hypothetical protein